MKKNASIAIYNIKRIAKSTIVDMLPLGSISWTIFVTSASVGFRPSALRTSPI